MKYVKPQKTKANVSNLLEQRKNNIKKNVGEVDIRHSIDNTVKTMHYNSMRESKDYDDRGNRSLTSYRVAHPSVDESRAKNKLSARVQQGRRLTHHYDRFIANSPSCNFFSWLTLL
jgi:hypothetical protein